MSRLKQVSWYAIAAVLLVLSMYVIALDGGVPDIWLAPVGATAIVAATLSLREER